MAKIAKMTKIVKIVKIANVAQSKIEGWEKIIAKDILTSLQLEPGPIKKIRKICNEARICRSRDSFRNSTHILADKSLSEVMLVAQ